MTEPTPVLLVDLSSIGHPIWHVSQAEPDPDYTSQRTAAIVRMLAYDHPHTAICCDAPGSFRKELDPTYKANRPAAEAALHHQIDLAREALEADGLPVWRVDGFEGDDLIATATALITGHHCNNVLIASADKDLLALVCDSVEVHDTRTGYRLGPAEVRKKLGVDPCQVVDYLTLVGDASDNIKGAKGIGPKTAAALLEMFGNLDDVYRALDSGEAGLKPAQVASLKELRPRLDAVRALVTMRTDVPLDVAQVFNERVPKAAETFMEDEPMEDEPMEDDLRMEHTLSLLANQAEVVRLAGPDNQRRHMEHTRQSQPPKPDAPEPDHFPALAPSPQLLRKKEEPEPETALVPAVESAPDEWERGLEPRCMADAVRLAQRMHDSRMFSAYGTPQAVLSTMLLGRELGMPAMAALRSVHIIEGKHSLSADLMVALVLKSRMAEYFQLVESTDKACTFETKRKGAPQPQRLSYTIDDAEKAGIARKGNWAKMPKQMLRARAKSELARLEYPDLLAGLYTPEELRDGS